jgi:hypothetical protein
VLARRSIEATGISSRARGGRLDRSGGVLGAMGLRLLIDIRRNLTAGTGVDGFHALDGRGTTTGFGVNVGRFWWGSWRIKSGCMRVMACLWLLMPFFLISRYFFLQVLAFGLYDQALVQVNLWLVG